MLLVASWKFASILLNQFFFFFCSWQIRFIGSRKTADAGRRRLLRSWRDSPSRRSRLLRLAKAGHHRQQRHLLNQNHHDSQHLIPQEKQQNQTNIFWQRFCSVTCKIWYVKSICSRMKRVSWTYMKHKNELEPNCNSRCIKTANQMSLAIIFFSSLICLL